MKELPSNIAIVNALILFQKVIHKPITVLLNFEKKILHLDENAHSVSNSTGFKTMLSTKKKRKAKLDSANIAI